MLISTILISTIFGAMIHLYLKIARRKLEVYIFASSGCSICNENWLISSLENLKYDENITNITIVALDSEDNVKKMLKGEFNDGISIVEYDKFDKKNLNSKMVTPKIVILKDGGVICESYPA